jgi:diadenosine tetraphosphate (Ap4A) HIT family hydrolase
VEESFDDCIACLLTSGRLPPPGGRIHRTTYWIVEHCVGALGVGALIVKPERHVLHVADLIDGEAAELGPLLRDAARVTTALTSPEQVYVSLWSHAGGEPGHIHYVVQPITRVVMDEFGYGPRVHVEMFAADRPLDLDAVGVFAEEARRLFAARARLA